MSHTLLAISLILLGLTIGGNSLQTGTETKVDLLKSLIYDNTKATVTLDSVALKQLIQFSSGSSNFRQRVSFSVYVRRKPLMLGGGQTVKYDAVLTNDGNGYDDRTGVFTCPVAGTYMFVVDSLSKPDIALHLKLNRKTVGKLYVSIAYQKTPLIQMSRTVVLKLKVGDHVKVENHGGNSYIYHDLSSGFNGVLLY
uniref:C1q domain-containing protein n=1 Tax=Magallana gigas TaxID=29159 RepID=A0A8W8IFR3_MAGGI|nr:complement C1q subcomponent subunit B-like [Crassostrea gigas]